MTRVIKKVLDERIRFRDAVLPYYCRRHRKHKKQIWMGHRVGRIVYKYFEIHVS